MHPNGEAPPMTDLNDPDGRAGAARGADDASPAAPPSRPQGEPAAPAAPAAGLHSIRLEGLSAFYGDHQAVKDVSMGFGAGEVTAIIGPSGCGKSTMVRCINRMHEEIPGARFEGRVLLDEIDLHAPDVDVVAVRRVVGMVFQKPNPFPTMSVYDNVAAGLRFVGTARDELDDRVREALVGAQPLGRGQGPPRQARGGALGRPAAAALHRAGARRRPRGPADGRALLGARPGRDAAHRGADRRAEAAGHDRDRHPQHAAGGAGRRHDRVHAERRAGRGRRDGRIFTNPADERTEQYVSGKFG